MFTDRVLNVFKQLYTWDSPVGINYKLKSIKQYDSEEGDGYNTFDFTFEILDTNEKNPKRIETVGTIDLPTPDEGVIDGKSIINVANENKRVTCRYDKVFIGSKQDLFNRLGTSWVITIKKDKTYDYCTITPPDKKVGEDIKLNSRSLFKYYNIPDVDLPDYKDFEIPEEDIKNIRLVSDKIQFDEKTTTTIKYLTKDNDKLTGKLDKHLVEDIAWIWNHRKEIDDERLYNPLDFDYLDFDGVLEQYLLHQTNAANVPIMNGLRNDLSNHWTRDGKISLVKLQATIGDLIKGSKSPLHDTEEPSMISPLSLRSESNKVNFKRKDLSGGYADIKLWTQKFIGIIDPVYTSDNANVASKNLKCKDVDFNNGDMQINLLTIDFKPVRVPLDTYVVSGVLSSDNVDYKNQKLVPNNDGTYTIYKFGDWIHTKDKKDIDYIRKQDGILCSTLANAPFINRSYEMRAMLSQHMVSEQSVHTEGSVPDIIYTGDSENLYDESKLNVKSPVDGVVTEVDKDQITIKNNNGRKVTVSYTSATNTSDKTGIINNPVIKVGDKVKKDEVIVENNAFEDKSVSLQIPLLTAYADYFGWTHEDAVVLSYSAARKIGHVETHTVEIPIYNNKTMIYPKESNEFYDDFGIIKEGSEIDDKHRLLMKYVYETDSVELNRKLEHKQSVFAPRFITTGYVDRVWFEKSKASPSTNDKDNKHANLDLYFKNKTGKEIPLYNTLEDEYGIINIRIVYTNYGKEGDKMTSRYGAKGVIGKIVPDDKMYKTKDGQIIDVLMSPLALYHRKIYSQIYESSLMTISKVVWNELDSRYNSKSEYKSQIKDTELKKAVKIIYSNEEKVPELDELYKKNKDYGFIRIRATAMDKYFTVDIIKELDELLQIEENQKLFIPELNTWTKQKIRVVWQSYYRLKFFAEKKLMASGKTRVLIDSNSNNFRSISGYGKVKSGAKIGEYEIFALKGYGANDLIKSFASNASKNEKASKMLSNLLTLSLTLKES